MLLLSLTSFAYPSNMQAVYPAFFALYVSKERRSSVQAMQMSNGLGDPIGLWLGHLMFDTIISVILSTVIVIIFAAVTNQFSGLGFFVRIRHTDIHSPILLTSPAVGGICIVWNCGCFVCVLRLIISDFSTCSLCYCGGLSSYHVSCKCM